MHVSLTARQWLLIMAGLCLAGVAAALVGQYRFGMHPCPWCILQRVLFVAIALVCAVGAALPSSAARRSAAGLSVAFVLCGIASALYQHFVAAKSSSCALTFADKIISGLKLDVAWPAMFEVTGSCADAVVSVLGIPFDFWSLGLFMLVGALALRVLPRA